MDLLNMETFGRIITYGTPQATAILRGGDLAPKVTGTVKFYRAGKGALVVAEVFHLPRQIQIGGKSEPAGPFYAFHIHEGSQCGSGSGDNPFAKSGGHFNPGHNPHPLHAGDMPPILSDNGYGFLSLYTSRFNPAMIIGRTVIIHQTADDFHTQPSGNPGLKIVCAKILASE